jgi:two-component system, NarL family, response regulator LiaR
MAVASTGNLISMKKFDVIIVDDHALFRKGISSALSTAQVLNRIYEAANGLEFLDLLKTIHPDIVLMDISMPVMDGIVATKRALSMFPELKVIALSMHTDMDHFQDMIDAGVMGFLSKDAALEDVISAITSVAGGNKVFSPDLMYNLVKRFNTTRSISDLLSEREKEVLQLISAGHSNQEIANSLNLSKRTIDKHRENILSKTQARNTAELIMFAIKNKLI